MSGANGSLDRLLLALALGGGTLLVVGCGPTYPNCEDDTHCEEKGEHCLNKVCAQCRDNSHCKGPGMECTADGKCRRRPGYCDDTVSCPGNQKCRDNECGAECLGDNECAENQYCDGGSCIARPQCGENALTAECAPGMKCSGGRCIPNLTACRPGEPIYFDFDRSNVKRNQREKLDGVFSCLQGEHVAPVRLEGHADERGTEEYNLALGQRRADAVRKYLEQKGVSPDRLSTTSYGEEQPAENGHNERSWSKNRRVEFNPQR